MEEMRVFPKCAVVFSSRPSSCGIIKLMSWLRLWMGAVKPLVQLYSSPTALRSQYLAWDCYCTYVVQTPSVERRICLEQIRPNRNMRGRPMFDVNTKFAAEFTFRCVQKPNKRTYEEQESKAFSSSFFVKHYCAKAKKSKPSSLELNRTPALQNIPK